MSDLWTTASADVERDHLDRHVTAAKVASAAVWPFLAASVNERDYANRKALVADRIERIAAAAAEGDPALFGKVHAAVQDGLDEDFTILHSSRLAEKAIAVTASRAEQDRQALIRTALERKTLERVLAAGLENLGEDKAPKFGEDGEPQDDSDDSDSDEMPEFIKDKIEDKESSKTASTKTASTYCPNHGVYVGEGNSEQHNECSKEQRKSKESKTAAQHPGGAWKAQVAGSGEHVWSENALRFDSAEEAEAYARDLLGRWFGADLARVVPAETPNREPVDSADPAIVINYRTASRRTASSCSCATHSDGSVTTMLCPAHAPEDPCATMAAVTGQRRKGSIVGGVCSACGWSASKTASKTAGENPFPPKKDPNEVDAGAPDPVDGASDVWTCPNCQGTDAYTQGGKELADALSAGEPIKCGGCQQVDSGQQEAQDPQQQAPNQAPVNPAATASRRPFVGRTASSWEHGLGEGEGQIYVCPNLQCDFVGTAAEMEDHRREAHPEHILNASLNRTAARIDTLRRILERKQHEEMEGVLMDTFTASALVAVYDALSPDNQAKFDSIPLDKLAELAWRVTGAKGPYDPTDNPYLTNGVPDEMADGPRILPTNADDSPVPSTTRPRQQPQGTHDTPQPVVQGFASRKVAFGTPGDPTSFGVGGDHCPHCGSDWKQRCDSDCLRQTSPDAARRLEAEGEKALAAENARYNAEHYPNGRPCPICNGNSADCRNCGGTGKISKRETSA